MQKEDRRKVNEFKLEYQLYVIRKDRLDSLMEPLRQIDCSLAHYVSPGRVNVVDAGKVSAHVVDSDARVLQLLTKKADYMAQKGRQIQKAQLYVAEVEHALEALEPSSRLILEKVYQHNYTYRQIAADQSADSGRTVTESAVQRIVDADILRMLEKRETLRTHF